MDTPKNILLVSHISDLSGAPISLVLLANRLKQNDYNVIFTIPRKGPLENVLQKNNIEYIIIGSLFPILKLKKIVTSYNIDLVHANTIVSLWVAIFARFMNIKSIIHIREDLSGKSLKVKLIEKIADRIIVISNYMKDFFSSIAQEKVRRVYNGVDFSLFKSISEVRKKSLCEELGIAEDDIVIALIGTYEMRKGQDVLVEAMKMFNGKKKIKCLMIGKSLPGQIKYQKSLVKEVLLNNLPISFIPPRSDIPDILQVIDIVCVLSRAEPFGRVVIEAMAAGKPVIGTRVGGIKEIIVDNDSGLLIEPDNPRELSKVLEKLVEDDATRESLGKSGFKRAKESFSVDKYAEEIIKIYKELT